MMTLQGNLHMWGRKPNQARSQSSLPPFMHEATVPVSALESLGVIHAPCTRTVRTVLRDNSNLHVGVSQKADVHLLVKWGNQGLYTWPSQGWKDFLLEGGDCGWPSPHLSPVTGGCTIPPKHACSCPRPSQCLPINFACTHVERPGCQQEWEHSSEPQEDWGGYKGPLGHFMEHSMVTSLMVGWEGLAWPWRTPAFDTGVSTSSLSAHL